MLATIRSGALVGVEAVAVEIPMSVNPTQGSFGRWQQLAGEIEIAGCL